MHDAPPAVLGNAYQGVSGGQDGPADSFKALVSESAVDLETNLLVLLLFYNNLIYSYFFQPHVYMFPFQIFPHDPQTFF